MSLFYWCDVGFLACPSPKGWQVELGLLHRLWFWSPSGFDVPHWGSRAQQGHLMAVCASIGLGNAALVGIGPGLWDPSLKSPQSSLCRFPLL